MRKINACTTNSMQHDTKWSWCGCCLRVRGSALVEHGSNRSHHIRPNPMQPRVEATQSSALLSLAPRFDLWLSLVAMPMRCICRESAKVVAAEIRLPIGTNRKTITLKIVSSIRHWPNEWRDSRSIFVSHQTTTTVSFLFLVFAH